MKVGLNKNKKANGFALIETILAGFILTFGIVAVLSLMSANLKYSFDARNQEVASLLAQEGVELARNIRDNNWAKGNPSFDNLPTTNNCCLDMNSSSCGGNSKLYLSGGSGGFYLHSSGTATIFSRKIIINHSGSTARITSVVIWGGSFPSGAVNYGNCNSSSKCAFTEVELSQWGEATP